MHMSYTCPPTRSRHTHAQVLLLWVSSHRASEYRTEVDEVVRLAGATGFDVTFVDMQPFTVGGGFRKGGWEAQQAVKLLSAYIATGEWLVIFDAKNAIMQELPAHTFVTEDEKAILNGACTL